MLIPSGVYKYLTLYGCCIAAVFNLIVVPISVLKSKYSLGSFKIIMIVFSTTNMLHYFVDTFSLPRFYASHKLSIVYISGHAKEFGQFWGTFCGIWLCNIFMLQVFLEALHFLYRYTLLCKEKWRFLLSTRNVVKFLALSIPVYVAIHTANFIYLTPFDEDVWSALENDPNYSLDIRPTDLYGIAMLYVKRGPHGEEITRWCGIAAVGVLLGCNALVISTMIFCGVKMHCHINDFTTASSKRTREMHKTLFQMLIAQTIAPLVLLHTPCAVLLVGSFFLEFGNSADLMMLAILIYPVIEPLIVIYFLNRKRFRRFRQAVMNKSAAQSSVGLTTVPLSSIIA